MIPRATEDTVSSLLRDELQRLGVKVELFPQITTPAGLRKPDLFCINAGSYPVEAKFTERDLVQAVAKVQNDYLKHYRVLGLKGGFAILYPEELTQPMPPEAVGNLARRLSFKLIAMFPPEDPRPFTVYDGKLQEVAKILSEHILAPPKRVEPSIDYIMKSLRESVLYIQNGLRHLKGYELEVFFGGKDVFKNILQYEEGKYPVEELRSAAAYLLLNQILFYQVLSRTRREMFEEIDTDKIRRPKDLNNYFRKVLDVNYKTVYSYDVASLIPQEFVDQVKTMVNLVQGLSPEKVGGDLLGTIFHDLIPFETRKNVAAFYTNVLAAELLASLSIDSADAKVADLAVGSGGLLVAAYRRKKELLGRPMTQEDHRRFVEEDLLGIDVMPFAANVAACHLALQSPEYFTNRVNVAVWDSTCLRPGMKIPSVTEAAKGYLTTFMFPKTTEKGAVSLTDKEAQEIELEKYDVVIMNPPFTRQERLPDDYKGALFQRLGEYRDYLHGQLGLYGFFILLADRFLKEGGRMALVLPATVLRVKSCEGIRKFWSEKYHVEHIITTMQRSAFSESVRFREILIIARKGRPNDDARTNVTLLKKIPTTVAEAKEITELIGRSKKDLKDDRMVLKTYSYSKLIKDVGNWFKYIAASDPSLIDLMDELIKPDKLVKLSSIIETQRTDLEHYKFGSFHGFIVSDQSRAQKKIDVWIVEKVERGILVARHRNLDWEVKIPLNALGRGLRRLSYVNMLDVSDSSDYLILSWFDDIKDMAKSLLPSKDLGKLKRPVVESWKEKFDSRKCHVLLARRFDLSAPGTSLLAFYSEKPVVGVDMWCIRKIAGEKAKLLTLWLNSSLSLLQILIHRAETRGAWMKIHDYMLDQILAPDFSKITDSETKQLLKIFEAVKKAKFPSILEQLRGKHPVRQTIDKAWLKTLGYKGNYDNLLNKLYNSLASEIELLRTLMAEGVVEEEEDV
ncbi:MAG: N-6 DNA methylase [Thermoproteota archaeon]